VTERHGSRFTDGGYQAPATNSASIERGQPVRDQAWTIGDERITLKLVPLLHGRPELYEVEYQRNDPVRKWACYTPALIRGEAFAREAWAMTAAELDAGRIPDVVLMPEGVPLGP
jgi:hypothetical protein